MLTVNKHLPRGHGLSAALVRRSAQVELDWDVRQKSRFDADDSQGRALGVFLPRGTVVRGGDVLVATDGSLVQVLARPQPVMRVSICAQHGRPFDLLRAAYHLGNRHVPLELQPDHLQIEPDHVLAEMLQQMDLIVTSLNAPFEPEGGAYSTVTGHRHSNDRSAAATPGTAVGVAAPHVHGPGCHHGH